VGIIYLKANAASATLNFKNTMIEDEITEVILQNSVLLCEKLL